MSKFEITYSVEIDPQTDNPGLEANFWLVRVLNNPDVSLPDHVDSVQTIPTIKEIRPKATPITEKPKKGSDNE
jgi:hypothetical protein